MSGIGRMLAMAGAVAMVAAGAAAKPPTEEQVAMIRAALPSSPQVKPEKARKILVFTLTKGFRHSSIECGILALRELGAATGAFDMDESADPQVFALDSLKMYNAVVFLNTTGALFEDAALKQGLLDYVNQGGGVVGIHAATDCFYTWPEFGRMMGGYFDGHPWHEPVTLKIEEPGHPCNACFEGSTHFNVTDEIYQFKAEPYSRKVLRVLTSLDVAKVDMTKKGIKRTDNDFGVSWVHRYGKGRVFYCSLGHREEIYWNPVILKYYLSGIQFATGDLKADASPRPEVKP